MDRSSRTAELAALGRASLTREPEAIRGKDTMAIQFLGAPLRFVVRTEPLRRVVLRVIAARLPGAYGFLLSREKVFDEFVQRELASGATQLVILGAGYDTRAYRFAAAFASGSGNRVFEVDAPPTSVRKQARVIGLMGLLPPHVSYVKVDFDRDTLEDCLMAAGYNPSARTVFTWEGVSFYIGSAAVDAVLAFVANRSGPKSAIVFDYLFKSVLDGTSDIPGAAASVKYVKSKGEPFTFGLDQRALGPFLVQRGLTLEDDLQPGELEARFVGEHARKWTHQVARFYGIVTARARALR